MAHLLIVPFVLKQTRRWYRLARLGTTNLGDLQNTTVQKATFAHLHQMPACVRSLSIKRQIPRGLSS